MIRFGKWNFLNQHFQGKEEVKVWKKAKAQADGPLRGGNDLMMNDWMNMALWQQMVSK